MAAKANLTVNLTVGTPGNAALTRRFADEEGDIVVKNSGEIRLSGTTQKSVPFGDVADVSHVEFTARDASSGASRLVTPTIGATSTTTMTMPDTSSFVYFAGVAATEKFTSLKVKPDGGAGDTIVEFSLSGVTAN